VRILVVSAWPELILDDGASLTLHNHLRLLRPAHDIRVITTERPAQPAIDYARRRVQSEFTHEPAHVHWVERPALMASYREALASNPPDVVHLHGWGTAQLSRFAGNTPTLHVAVDAWGRGWENRILPVWRRMANAGQLNKVRRHERRHYPRCGVVVVVAPTDAEYLKVHAPGARVEVVTNGIEAGPPPAPPSDAPVVGFHGAFETAANAEGARFLVERVLPLIRQARPDARVMLIGRRPEPIADLAGEHVTVTGAVPDMRDALAQVSVYAAALVSGQGMKFKVLEAMAAGLPVVATPLGLSGIGASEGIVEAPTAEAIASAVLEFLASADARRAAGAANRQRVEREFTCEQSAGRIEGLWRELAR
jgi:glycosyltransferase involved in cell wall biosynthesis